MSPTELLILEKGRVPAWIVLNEIKAFVREEESPTSGEEGPLRTLAIRSGILFDTIGSWFRPSGGVQSIAFDDADRLFCAMHRHHLWRGPYADYYYGVNLGPQTEHQKRREDVCRNGHERTPENTKIRKDGRRECGVCERINSRRHYARKMGYAA